NCAASVVNLNNGNNLNGTLVSNYNHKVATVNDVTLLNGTIAISNGKNMTNGAGFSLSDQVDTFRMYCCHQGDSKASTSPPPPDSGNSPSPKPCESDLNQNDTNRLIVPRAKGRYFGHTNPAAGVHSNGTFHTNGNNVNHAAQSDTDAALKTVQLKNLN